MLIIALLLHLLGHYLFQKITKTKAKEFRDSLNRKQPLFEMSGVIMNFVVAILIILVITLTTKERYLLNENAIYGVECSSIANEKGFIDGDKFITINDAHINRFSEITKSIIFDTGITKISIDRDRNIVEINLTEDDKYDIMSSGTLSLFKPKTTPNVISNEVVKELVYTEKNKSIGKSFGTFFSSAKIFFNLFNPYRIAYKGIKGFYSIKGGVANWYTLALCSYIIGLINLIPLPGLDLGNTIIAIIENNRKRKFNSKTMRFLRIGSPLVLVVILVSLLFISA
ncbi:MAG: site-2 protease family protein [Flavobacteriaceae bacterium]|nr:site-2 protease family protein [Flavobacteriaceae bacterium]